MIREVKIKANGNNRKRPSLVQRKNENRKEKRRINKQIKRPVRHERSGSRVGFAPEFEWGEICNARFNGLVPTARDVWIDQ